MNSFFLSFSDSVKVADAARQMVQGQGLVVHHSFFSSAGINAFNGLGWPINFLPLNSLFLTAVFRFLPISDVTVMLTGLGFYILSGLLVLFLGRKLHSWRVGIVALIMFLGTQFFWNYALNFSSETLFIFELLWWFWFLLGKKSKKILSVIPVLMMIFTRPQWLVFVAAMALAWVWVKYGWKKALLFVFSGGLVFLFLLYKPNSSVYLKSLYSIQTNVGVSQGEYLRGRPPNKIVLYPEIAKKFFFNTYNFAKDPGRIAPEIIITLFILGLFFNFGRNGRLLKATVVVALAFFTAAAAVSIPNARYIHPLVPLMILIAATALVKVSEKLYGKNHPILLVAVLGIFLVPSLGYLTLDARFRAKQFNNGQPPARWVIPQEMAKYIPPGQLVITNLDAWAGWYQDLSTMWFPLTPDMLKATNGGGKVKYIVITNYLEDDADFALGPWREVVYDSDNIQDQYLKANFRVLTTFDISATDVYENQEYKGTILQRKEPRGL